MTSGGPDKANRKALMFCTDARGLPFACYAAWRAAIAAHERDFDIVICSMDALQIPDTLGAFGIKMQVLDLATEMQELGIKPGYYPLESYLRIWLPRAFQGQYDRILYMDFDTETVSGDLSRLMDIDLEGHFIAGARDLSQILQPRRGYSDFRKHGLPTGKYFNSGVLLFDVDAFIRRDALALVRDAKRKLPDQPILDQGLINVSFYGKIAELSPVWNWQIWASMRIFGQLFHPHVLHYIARRKPWNMEQAPDWFPFETIERYGTFVARHFPDRAYDVPQRKTVERSAGWVLPRLFRHAVYYPRVRRFMKAFDDDYAIY